MEKHQLRRVGIHLKKEDSSLGPQRKIGNGGNHSFRWPFVGCAVIRHCVQRYHKVLALRKHNGRWNFRRWWCQRQQFPHHWHWWCWHWELQPLVLRRVSTSLCFFLLGKKTSRQLGAELLVSNCAWPTEQKELGETSCFLQLATTTELHSIPM